MIRRATFRDIDRLNDLLFQVQKIHADKRPDIFKQGAKKYTVRELETIIADDRTPVFVYESDQGVQGYAFCIYRTTEDTVYRRPVCGSGSTRQADWDRFVSACP